MDGATSGWAVCVVLLNRWQELGVAQRHMSQGVAQRDEAAASRRSARMPHGRTKSP